MIEVVADRLIFQTSMVNHQAAAKRFAVFSNASKVQTKKSLIERYPWLADDDQMKITRGGHCWDALLLALHYAAISA